MKRIFGSILLIVCLIAVFVQPVFAAPETRSVQIYTTSEQGIAFVNEMMGGSYGGTQQLRNAEAVVNSFITTYQVSISQQQFDALVDLVMAYGSYILTSGYKIETLIASGSYSEVELANAFCAWVKDGSEFSQLRLNRRLREIKLFLYGSYDGICGDVSFRYVIFYPNGGTLEDNTILCYSLNEAYSSLPLASRSGKYFAGWYTSASGGSHLCNGDVVTDNQTVYARWSDSPVENPNEPGSNDGGYDEFQLRTSEDCIQFIKLNEGFCKYAIWDYAQYSIGYGTRCEPWEFPNGITEEEADYRLRQMLQSFEKTIEGIEDKRAEPFSQQQFDALISFTMNLGNQWIAEDKKIYQYVLNGGYTEMEFVNAMGSWASAGGNVLAGLMRRRMDEANMYLNGSYEKGSIRYFGICFKGMEGTADRRVAYYMTGQPLGALPGASRSGYHLDGWYDKTVGGTQYTEQTIAPSYGTLTLYAHWAEGELPTEPTEPSEDTSDATQEPTESTDPSEPNEESTEEPTQEPTEPSAPSISFTDVSQSAWYYDYVAQAVQEGLFGGVSESRFAPENTMTRAMLVTVLHRLAGKPEAAAPSPFNDVQTGQWYDAAVRWAYETRIVNGISQTKFGVNGNVTREQLTTMLYRYAQYYGIDTTAKADISAFRDNGKVSDYAVEAMCWAVAEGIVSGDGVNLMPKGNATRAQCAKMMVIFSQKAETQAEEATLEPTESTEAATEATEATEATTEATETTEAVTEPTEAATEQTEAESVSEETP